MTTAQETCTIINGVNVDGLNATIEAVKATPEIAKFRFNVRNKWKDGGQNASTVNEFYGAGQEQARSQPFVLEADEPVILLGKDNAANPAEYLLHALASCLTSAMVYHAAARGVQIEAVESSIEGNLDARGLLNLDNKVRPGYQGIRVNFKVKADVPDEQLQEIAQLGPRFSPVFDSVTNGVPVSFSAERL
ncbi:MAG: OsmC family protein [Acidobacteria bacterium]|nr:OsmC family protein [Acidobacteriota bacterium]